MTQKKYLNLMARLANKPRKNPKYIIFSTPKTERRFRSHIAELGDADFNDSMPQFAPLTSPLRDQRLFSLNAASSPLVCHKNRHYTSVISGPSLRIMRSTTTQEREPIQFNIESEKIKQSHQYFPALFKEKPSQFSFTITKKGIKEREGIRRPKSQNNIMGMSALDAFKQLGATIAHGAKGLSFHHAHRQGWALGGKQEIENLDIGTAGSNYQTLFTIEAPCVDKVQKDDVEIQVKGTVIYDELLPIARRINYDISWGNSIKISKSIYPLFAHKPSLMDNKLSIAAFNSVASPINKAMKGETHPLKKHKNTDEDHLTGQLTGQSKRRRLSYSI